MTVYSNLVRLLTFNHLHVSRSFSQYDRKTKTFDRQNGKEKLRLFRIFMKTSLSTLYRVLNWTDFIQFTHCLGSCIPSHSTTCSTEKLVKGFPDSCHCPSIFSMALRKYQVYYQHISRAPDKRGIHISFLCHHENLCCGYALEAPL